MELESETEPKPAEPQVRGGGEDVWVCVGPIGGGSAFARKCECRASQKRPDVVAYNAAQRSVPL